MEMKIFFTSKRTIAFVAFVLIGFLFLFLKKGYLYPAVLITLGILICLAGIVKLTLLNKQLSGTMEFTFDLLEGIVNLIVGVVIVNFWDFRWITFGCGCIYAIIPILRIVLSEHRINQLVVDILKYLAIVVLISSFNRVLTVRYVVSSIFFAVAIIIFITLIIKIKKEKRGVYLHEIEN